MDAAHWTKLLDPKIIEGNGNKGKMASLEDGQLEETDNQSMEGSYTQGGR